MVFKTVIRWLPVVVVSEIVAGQFISPYPPLVLGSILVVGLLALRTLVAPAPIDFKGLECKDCGTTFAHRSPFFTDLDANPRQLTVSDVPRPLGRSEFVVGQSVED
ncbi:MAG: hypothetical protein K8J08_11800 [Thermoanaerobaculia bacterium]|nr:hypothetical protein [Thermoanaerobaculia bacterium]